MSSKDVLELIAKNYGPHHKLAEAQAAQLAKNIQVYQQTGKISATFYCMATGRSMNYPNKEYQQSILKRYGGDVVKMYTSFVSKRATSAAKTKPASSDTSAPKTPINPDKIRILSSVECLGIADKAKDTYKYRYRRWHDDVLVSDEQRIW